MRTLLATNLALCRGRQPLADIAPESGDEYGVILTSLGLKP
jgi:hypothetical protein